VALRLGKPSRAKAVAPKLRSSEGGLTTETVHKRKRRPAAPFPVLFA